MTRKAYFLCLVQAEEVHDLCLRHYHDHHPIIIVIVIIKNENKEDKKERRLPCLGGEESW